ncbi:GAF domain-containing sensor histidine kinase [uncultured Paludibaculum sp.]|uniref:GAF domain-containing sensor histidine kinase n=1 Tax=uncultured Paludibaculum sp. TaxID=1765020 RepID=UPI002AAB9DDA|nr:GAF domain-containing sensor histidine kinase [uncultured Paludibaculum sp.]
MRAVEHPEVLAEAAAGLSHQLQAHLHWMAELLAPHLATLERKFLTRLRMQKLGPSQRDSLASITAGAAAQCLAAGEPLSRFLEKVQYRGRRLAKLGLTPTAVVAALGEYDKLLSAELLKRCPDQVTNLSWVRNQLHFLVILSLNSAFYQVREGESQAFYELFRVEVESRTLEEMLPRFLAALLTYTGADDGRLYLLEEDEKTWISRGVRPGEAHSVPLGNAAQTRRDLTRPRCIAIGAETASMVLDKKWHRSFHTCWSVPLRAEGKLRGVLQFAFRKSYEWMPREVELLSAAAERCWLAAEKARLLEDLARREEQVRRLAEHMVEVEESERRRISRELHDEAGQSLLCVRLQLEMLEQELPAEFEPWRKRMNEVREMTEHTIVEIRRLIAALSPAILDQIGLAAALRQLIGRFRNLHSAEVRLQLPRKLDLPKKMSIILYRLVQEIFNNIAKYSLATRVNLSVDSADGCLRMQVEDDGIGFDVDEAFSRRDCFGLSGLRERVALLGGTLEVRSHRKAKTGESAGWPELNRKRERANAGKIGIDRHGTLIRVVLPLPPRNEGAERPKRS